MSVTLALMLSKIHLIVYVSAVAFSETIDAETIQVFSQVFDRFQSWNQEKVTVYMFPKYYLHPWKNVLLCVDEKIEKYIHLWELIC